MTSAKVNRKVLLVGATGTVGGAALRELVARGASVRALVRSAEAARKLSKIETVLGDLRDAAAIARALDGVSTAVYVSPHEPDEELLAEQFIRACEDQGVRLVFVGVHIDGSNRWLRAIRRGLFGRFLPHYRPKFRIAERARRSRTNSVVLMPTNFFQNDEVFLDEIESGAFSQPFERKMNRVDVRDIADAIARACLDPTLPAGAYPVVGPESLDGAECAEAWTRALGQDVRYVGSEPERFQHSIVSALSHKKRADFLASYA
ncbi:MAG TPA: NAD(P)H-binding protein, partial [Polyangiales bacterium]|nr:NAD(P)H-binding protein [Polyangiales bacterium]